MPTPNQGETFPSPAPLVRDCEPASTALYGRWMDCAESASFRAFCRLDRR